MKTIYFIFAIFILFNVLYSFNINSSDLYPVIQYEKDDLETDEKSIPVQNSSPEFENGAKIFKNITVDFGFLLSKAQGEFGRNVNNFGYGFNFDIGYNFVPLPIVAGISAGGIRYGSESREIPYSYYTDLVTLEEKTSNEILMVHLLLRLQPVTGKVRPYLDFLFGFKYLYTETSIRDEDNNDEEDEIASSINLDDSALSKGLGCGLKIKFYSWNNLHNSPENGLFINIGSRYLWGDNAEYLNVKKDGWIEISDPEEGPVTTTLHPDNSKTDLLIFQIGISIIF
jgi:hypothetical protein